MISNRNIGVFHSMNLAENTINGGVQKVYVNNLLAFPGSIAIQDKRNFGLQKVLSNMGVTNLTVEIETPTLNNDGGGLSVGRVMIMLLKLFYRGVGLRKRIGKQFETIIAHDITSAPYLFFIRANHKILFLHSNRMFVEKKARVLSRLLFLINKDTVFVAPTMGMIEGAKALGARKTQLIKTPVFQNEPVFYERSRGSGCFLKKTIKLVYIGRFSPIKNLIPMIELMFVLNKGQVNCLLDIYGEPFNDVQRAYLKEVEGKIAYYEMGNKIHFCGLTKNPIETFSNYDFSIILSDGEAIPLAGVESIAAGTPILGYVAEGISDLCSGGFGVLFERFNFLEDNIVLNKILCFDYNLFDSKRNKHVGSFSCENFRVQIQHIISQEKEGELP